MSRATTREASSFLVPDARSRPGDDPIFALNAEATRRARAGEPIVNATLGTLLEDDGKLAVMASVGDALRAVDPRRAALYAPIVGEPGFLSAVVRDLYGTGELASHSIAAATPGGTGALYQGIVNFLEPGHALLTSEHFWGPYQTIAEHTGRRVETFRTFDRELRFDARSFERALARSIDAQGRALVLLNTPCHNPTGYSLDAAEWQQVVHAIRAEAERAPVALMIDLAYAKFGGPRAGEWIAHASELVGEALLLVAWTASKSFAQYGARIGAVVATHPDAAERARLQGAFSFTCRGTWSNCNHLGMLAITALLDDAGLRARSDAERARMQGLLGERVQAFNAAARAAGLAFPRYEGGFFVSVFTAEPEKVAARMRELGVFVVPIAGAVRVALCSTPARDVPRLVDAVSEGLRATHEVQ